MLDSEDPCATQPNGTPTAPAQGTRIQEQRGLVSLTCNAGRKDVAADAKLLGELDYRDIGVDRLQKVPRQTCT